MKEKIKVIKEIWGNKRKRAILSLGLWIIFFIIIFFMIGKPPKEFNVIDDSTKSNSVNKNISDGTSIKKLSESKNYEYNELIEIVKNNQNITYNIAGTYFNEKYYFSLNDTSYYMIEDKIYVVDNENKTLKLLDSNDKTNIINNFDLRLVTPDKIYNNIKYSAKSDEFTTYKDGTCVFEYNYTDYKERITKYVITEKDNIVSKIVVDYNKYVNGDIYQQFKITINYENINNISNYSKDYSEYTILEEGE